jgi:hypothetical protein
LGEAGALDLFQDGGAIGFPAIRHRTEIMMGQVDVDGGASSRTLAKLPSRTTSSVSWRKKRSTRFIQEELVGVK